jgi:hypothetical protein
MKEVDRMAVAALKAMILRESPTDKMTTIDDEEYAASREGTDIVSFEERDSKSGRRELVVRVEPLDEARKRLLANRTKEHAEAIERGSPFREAVVDALFALASTTIGSDVELLDGLTREQWKSLATANEFRDRLVAVKKALPAITGLKDLYERFTKIVDGGPHSPSSRATDGPSSGVVDEVVPDGVEKDLPMKDLT